MADVNSDIKPFIFDNSDVNGYLICSDNGHLLWMRMRTTFLCMVQVFILNLSI